MQHRPIPTCSEHYAHTCTGTVRIRFACLEKKHTVSSQGSIVICVASICTGSTSVDKESFVEELPNAEITGTVIIVETWAAADVPPARLSK